MQVHTAVVVEKCYSYSTALNAYPPYAMTYRTLHQCLDDPPLDRTARPGSKRRLMRRLEAADIQRRVFRAGGRRSTLPTFAGAGSRCLESVRHDGTRAVFVSRHVGRRWPGWFSCGSIRLICGRRPRLYLNAPWHAWHARPRRVRRGPVLANETTIDQLPQLVSWPDDGGAYVTLPQVYSEDPDRPGLAHTRTSACIACSSPVGSIRAERRDWAALSTASRHRRPIMRRRFAGASVCG